MSELSKYNEECFMYDMGNRRSSDWVINIDQSVNGPENYRDLIRELNSASADDTFTFNINTSGGQVDTGIALIHAMKNTKAKTISNIITAYSLGGLLAFACDYVNVVPYGRMMIHQVQWASDFGDVNSIQRQMSSAVEMQRRLFNDIFDGFLNGPEINDILKGGEFWFNDEDILDRLEIRNKLFVDNKNNDESSEEGV